MLGRLVYCLKRDNEEEAKILGEFLSFLYSEKEANKEFLENYRKLKEEVKKERGTELVKLSPFWYPVVFYLSLLNIRANTFLALRLLEEKKLLDCEIKRRQYKVFYIYGVKNGGKKKIYATSSKDHWEYWFLLFNLVVSAPSFMRKELKEVGEKYYEALKGCQI